MKNIVFCADGTWNGTDVDDDGDGNLEQTNVLKTFHLLSGEPLKSTEWLQDEEEIQFLQNGQAVQVAKYIHGVGDSRNPVMKLLGGAFGSGLIARIVRGYTFISRKYDPDDRIFVIGFSRGAYTARALAGMISGVGLLNRRSLDLETKREMAYSLGLAAWRKYREQAMTKPSTKASVLQSFANMFATLPGYSSVPLRPQDLVPAQVYLVGVWDTVGALGIPTFGDGAGHPMDAFRFADNVLSDNVSFGIHALSLDEQRMSFLPTLWDDRVGITQLLFSGAHADVGGGYAEGESALSNIGLDWMIRQLQARGAMFAGPLPALPMNVTAPIHEPWKQRPFSMLPSGPRIFPPGLPMHPSVAARKAKYAAVAATGVQPAMRVPGAGIGAGGAPAPIATMP